MTPEQWAELKSMLQGALELAPAERSRYMEAQREDLRSELESLVRAYDHHDGFLESPALGDAGAEAPVEAEMIGRRYGPYRVLSLIGHGGMGSVWLAERVDGLFSRKVALKLVHPALVSRVTAERFTREREILGSLAHPNIARLLDAGLGAEGQPYLVLEYVAGKPLNVYCAERSCSLHERLELFMQVLSAVRYAHAHLVIHRDLKPSNILVTEDGCVGLLDFGIAKILSEGQAVETELTQLGGRALTPDYAAPEQIAGAPVTTAADVYALGVILYELLTGARPYRLKRDSRGALEDAILQADVLSPSRVVLSEAAARECATTPRKLTRALKGDLDTIVLKALKKVPAERYATVNALEEDIARFLAGDVVLAQRDSVGYRAAKFLRRNRLGVAVVSIVFLTLVAGLATTSYEADVAARQRDTARAAQLRLLTQAAAARLKDADVPHAMAIILEVLRQGKARDATPEVLNVFQETRAADAQLLVIAGHTDGIETAAFSPDGASILTASDDGTARVFSALTGAERLRLRGDGQRIVSAAFSPDGHRILTTSLDHTARTWDAASGAPLITLRGHTAPVERSEFSHDGRRIVTASADKTVRIWDAATGAALLLLPGHLDRVNAAAFSPDDRRIVTAAEDKTVRIWDAASGEQLRLLSGHTDRVMSAVFSPDGKHILSAAYDKTSRIWDAESGAELVRLTGHQDRVFSAAYAPDGAHVVTASSDHTARLWDAATGQQLRVFAGYAAQYTDARFSPDGKRILTAATDRVARVWDAGTSHELLRLSGHADRVLSAAFSPDGGSIATSSYDMTARVWEAASGKLVTLLKGHASMITCVAFSPDGKQLLTASGDRTARLWDLATGAERLQLTGDANVVWCAAFSPDGRRVITAADDASPRIWDAQTGRELLRLKGHLNTVVSAAFSPDGRRVITASADRTARIWDALTGRQLVLLSGHTEPVQTAAFSPDGSRVITGSDDKTARIWDASNGKPLVTLIGHGNLISSVAFSRDGQRVVTASFDRTARLWDATSGQQLAVLAGHTDLVESAQYAADGMRVVTASDDGTARIWDGRAPPLSAQIDWAEAAQFDVLSPTERFQLGLPDPPDLRSWPASPSKCDETAAAPYDPERRAPGVLLDQIISDIAMEACGRSSAAADKPRFAYQRGRALMAKGDWVAARTELEAAVDGGYKAARVELAMLLTEPAAGMLDPARSISLYERAWQEGVAIAGFKLGQLYEWGLEASEPGAPVLVRADAARAWGWYGGAARAGDPTALGRFAEKHFSLAEGTAGSERSSHLLTAFRHYASAAERARREDWPDAAWSGWRHGRARLARLLASEGMLAEAAQSYAATRNLGAKREWTLAKPWLGRAFQVH